MFETIKRLYSKSGDSVIVSNAVKKGWITAEQYEEITGDEYTGKLSSITTDELDAAYQEGVQEA